HSKQVAVPPLDGPNDIDTAVSDLANRLARVVRFADPTRPATVLQEIGSAVRRSFAYVNTADARNSVFPFQLALSFGTLFAQQGLRLLAASQVVRPGEYPSFLLDFFESATDSPVVISLEYRDLIERYKDQLAQRPHDDPNRVELQRTLNNCGLHDEATDNRLQAAGI